MDRTDAKLGEITNFVVGEAAVISEKSRYFRNYGPALVRITKIRDSWSIEGLASMVRVLSGPFAGVYVSSVLVRKLHPLEQLAHCAEEY